MTETRKNILRDVMCSVENLQDCLEVLLREEESCAAKLSGKPKKAAQYDASMQACEDLRTVIGQIGKAVKSAERLQV